jgi:hypothetical protein
MSEITVRPITEWPTMERLRPVLNSLADASEALERLTIEFRALNGEFDPEDVAAESVPVTAESIAALVWFADVLVDDAEQISKSMDAIQPWPVNAARIGA